MCFYPSAYLCTHTRRTCVSSSHCEPRFVHESYMSDITILLVLPCFPDCARASPTFLHSASGTCTVCSKTFCLLTPELALSFIFISFIKCAQPCIRTIAYGVQACHSTNYCSTKAACITMACGLLSTPPDMHGPGLKRCDQFSYSIQTSKHTQVQCTG